MLSFKSFDPKNIVPKLYKLGLYTLTVQGSGTNIKIQINPDTEQRVTTSISHLFENFFDFEFKAQPTGSFDLELEEDVFK